MGSIPSAGTLYLMRSIALLLLLTPAAAAPAPPRPRCPQGQPHFTGLLFSPLRCPGGPDHKADTIPAAPRPLEAKDASSRSLKEFIGSWEGFAAYGLSRFEVLVSLEKKGWFGKGFVLRVETRDYQVLNKNVFRVELKPDQYGRFNGDVSLDTLPGAVLKAHLTLGDAPAAEAAEDPYQRELHLEYDGESGWQRLRLSFVGKDKLRYLYTDMDRPRQSVAGELTRSKRGSL